MTNLALLGGAFVTLASIYAYQRSQISALEKECASRIESLEVEAQNQLLDCRAQNELTQAATWRSLFLKFLVALSTCACLVLFAMLHSSTKEAEALRKRLQMLDKARERRSAEIKVCLICLDNDLEVILEPCFHVVMCYRCSDQLRYCPVCRTTILSKKKVFLP